MASVAWTSAVRSCTITARKAVSRSQCASSLLKGANNIHPKSQTHLLRNLRQDAWFSSMPPKSSSAEAEDHNNNSMEPSSSNPTKVSPRYILNTLPTPFTPGQALFVLQKKGADGSLLSRTDVTQLCEAARTGHSKDAKVILNALMQFQRCWKFQLRDPKVATAASENMMRAILKYDRNAMVEQGEDESPVYTPESKIKAGLFVGQAFIKRETGLYYALRPADIEQCLSMLWEGMQESYSDEEAAAAAEEEETEESAVVNMKKEDPSKLAALYLINPNPSVPRRRIKKRARYVLKRIFGNMSLKKLPPASEKEEILKMAKEVFYTLLIRSSHPENKMKKKSKKAYLTKLVQTDGPSEEIVELVTKIVGFLGGSAEAKSIVEMWEKKLTGAGVFVNAKHGLGAEALEAVETGGLWAIVSELEEKENMGLGEDEEEDGEEDHFDSEVAEDIEENEEKKE